MNDFSITGIGTQNRTRSFRNTKRLHYNVTYICVTQKLLELKASKMLTLRYICRSARGLLIARADLLGQ